MPLRIADIKKTVRSRGDGERYIHPKLLEAAAAEGQVSLALAYFQARLGRRRRDFEPELLVRFFGDPKVARGLVACLGATYRWRTQSFADVLDPPDLLRLGSRGIRNPSDLRLQLFDLVNQEGDGFLAGDREAALLALARPLGLPAPVLEALFTLDAEENAILVRVGTVPDPLLAIGHYNFQVVHALIRNCLFLEFAGLNAGACRALTGACQAHGVSVVEQAGSTRLQNRADTFGNFARWGQRVARALYAAAALEPSLLQAGRVCVQTGGRPAWYLCDRRTLSALTAATGSVHCAALLPEFVAYWQRQRLARGTGGWQLVGAAEPLVCTAGLAVPSYALRREERQVLLWPVATPLEAAAVTALHGAGVPVLALCLPACSASPGPEVATVDWEAGAGAVVEVLNGRWGEGRADASAQALEGLLAELESRGFIPEAQVCEALGCASLDVMPGRLRALDPARGRFLPGLGLCSPGFAQAMQRALRRKPHPRPAA